MAKKKSKFVCNNCGSIHQMWAGKCNECNEWNTIIEEIDDSETKKMLNISDKKYQHPVKLEDIKEQEKSRIRTGIGELDRVLGGGIVQGSLVLVGGTPGIGKSTLLLQLCNMKNKDLKILYVSGEESLSQIKMRASRLDVNNDNLYLISENDIDTIKKYISDIKPDVLIIDSIQTIYSSYISSVPGSVTQVRNSTGELMTVSKSNNISTFLIGHVTKSGELAGPKLLEHMVDTVLSFEGEKHSNYRIIRATKNRFGSTNEIGIFEMTSIGLLGIDNPSDIFLSNGNKNMVGTIISCSMEGTRPILLELQSLVNPTGFGTSRRATNGVDFNRLVMILAVIEKYLNIPLSDFDAYINIVGGLSVDEPAIDAALLATIISSYYNKPISNDTVIIGEVGLTGEIRGINMIDNRLKESIKLGYKNIIIPDQKILIEIPDGYTINKVSSIKDLNSLLF